MGALSRSKTSCDTNNDRKVIARRSKPTPATASDWKGAATVRGVVVCIECSDDSDNDQVEAWVGSRKSADRRKSAKVVSGRGIVHSSPIGAVTIVGPSGRETTDGGRGLQ